MIPLLLTKLRDLRYAFYAQDVVEIMLCPTLSSYHSDQSLVDGLFRLGKAWIPVVSLSSLINQPPLEFGLFDVLVMVRTDPVMAIRVSAVDGIKRFHWNELKPLDSPVDGGPSVAARLEVDSEPTLLLVASELVLEKERQLLRKLTEQMSMREDKAGLELEKLGGE